MNSRAVFGSGALCAVLSLLGCTCPCAGNQATTPAVAAPSATLDSTAGSVVAVKTCAGSLIPAANGLVDDSEDNDNRISLLEGRDGYWWDAKDDKGSTIEPSTSITMSEGGAHASKFAVHVTGKTAAQADKAWGAVVGFRLAQGSMYDASRYAGVSFFAKAGEKSESQVRLKVGDVNTQPDGKVCKEGCYNDFGKDLSLGRDWQEYKISFAEMKQQEGWGDPRPPAITAGKLIQIAWHMTTPGAEFDVWLDDIRFLDCQ